jgi:hypothetical protein
MPLHGFPGPATGEFNLASNQLITDGNATDTRFIEALGSIHRGKMLRRGTILGSFLDKSTDRVQKTCAGAP